MRYAPTLALGHFTLFILSVGAGFSRPNAPTNVSADASARVFSGRQTLPLQSFLCPPRKTIRCLIGLAGEPFTMLKEEVKKVEDVTDYHKKAYL